MPHCSASMSSSVFLGGGTPQQQQLKQLPHASLQSATMQNALSALLQGERNGERALDSVLTSQSLGLPGAPTMSLAKQVAHLLNNSQLGSVGMQQNSQLAPQMAQMAQMQQAAVAQQVAQQVAVQQAVAQQAAVQQAVAQQAQQVQQTQRAQQQQQAQAALPEASPQPPQSPQQQQPPASSQHTQQVSLIGPNGAQILLTPQQYAQLSGTQLKPLCAFQKAQQAASATPPAEGTVGCVVQSAPAVAAAPSTSVPPPTSSPLSVTREGMQLSSSDIINEFLQMERNYGKAQQNMEALRAQLVNMGVQPCV